MLGGHLINKPAEPDGTASGWMTEAPAQDLQCSYCKHASLRCADVPAGEMTILGRGRGG